MKNNDTELQKKNQWAIFRCKCCLIVLVEKYNKKLSGLYSLLFKNSPDKRFQKFSEGEALGFLQTTGYEFNEDVENNNISDSTLIGTYASRIHYNIVKTFSKEDWDFKLIEKKIVFTFQVFWNGDVKVIVTYEYITGRTFENSYFVRNNAEYELLTM